MTDLRLRETGSGLRLAEVMPVRTVSERDRRFVLRVLQGVLLATVVGQRISLPLGLPVGLPLVACYAGVVLLRVRGAIRYNRVRSELYLAAAVALVAATWFTTWRGGDISLN